MWIFERCIAMKIQWISLVILTPWCGANLYPACTEDSQCVDGFYCEAGAHVCRQCILCSELHRESPLPPRDSCVKSVGDCGICVDGLVSEYDVVGGQCVSPESRGSGFLPVYAWVAIALSILLVFCTIGVVFKIKTFKVLYSSQTSVEPSLHTAPPPYNDVEVASSPSSPPPPDDVSLESSKLMELSHPCAPSSECPSVDFRLRENSESQTARVYSNPSYIRLLQNNSRCDTPETPVSVIDDYESSNYIIGETGDNHRLNYNEDHNDVTGAICKNSSRDPEIEDSNNNYSDEPLDVVRTMKRPNNVQYCSNMVAGPSFIINVVESINTIQQQK